MVCNELDEIGITAFGADIVDVVFGVRGITVYVSLLGCGGYHSVRLRHCEVEAVKSGLVKGSDRIAVPDLRYSKDPGLDRAQVLHVFLPEFNGAGNIRDALAVSGGNLDWLFIPREGERYSSYLPDLAKTVTPVKAVCNDAGYVSELALGESMISSPGDEIHTRSAVIRILTDKNGKTFYIFKNGDLSAVILPEPLTDLTGFEAETKDCGFMITSMDFPDGADFSSLKAAVIQAGSPRGEKVRDELLSQGINAYAVSRDGNLVIEARGGKAEIRRG